MNLLYITTNDIDDATSGVAKKIVGQVNAMKKAGIKASIIHFSKSNIYYKGKSMAEMSGSSVIKFAALLYQLYRISIEIIRLEKKDCVYIRYSIADFFLIRFLKKIKALECKVFIEFPTFPYDKEYYHKNFIKRLGLYIDKFFRKDLWKYVDLSFSPSNVKETYGIKCIRFFNGIEKDLVKERKYVEKKSGILRFLGVANIANWHGYDRLINGIRRYYDEGGDYKIMFNIVGDGPELKNLKNLVLKLQLEKYVLFYGRLGGQALDLLYDQSDIAVGTIAAHRNSEGKFSPLKSREACLRGIPFVSTFDLDDSFPISFPYMILVEQGESPIDIRFIIDRFSQMNPSEYLKSMREYGEQNFSWDVTFSKVIQAIKTYVSN